MVNRLTMKKILSVFGYVIVLLARAISSANAGTPIWGEPVTEAFVTPSFHYPSSTTGERNDKVVSVSAPEV